MITRTFGVGTFPDVCWWQGLWRVVAHTGDTLAIYGIWPDGQTGWRVEQPLGSSQGLAFPRLWSDEDVLWLAWRECVGDERAMLSHFVGEWSRETLTPAVGNHPVAFGFGFVAWQDKATGRIVRRCGTPIDTDAGPVCAVGLSRILPDGTVRTMDDDNHVQPGMTRPAWAGQYIVGEHHDSENRGLLLLNTETQAGLLWGRDRITKTPRVAVSPSGQIAVVTWGDHQPIALYLIDPSELTREQAIVRDNTASEFDVMGYVLGDLTTYPHMTANGEPWDAIVDSPKKLITFVLASDPTHTQVWRFDDIWLYLHWDGHKGQNPLGYTYTDGRWLRRMMRVGEKVDCPRNRLLRYSFTGEYRADKSHGLAYSVTLVAKYLAYPCGVLGMRPAIEWHYAIGNTYREINISVEGWGLYQWSSEELKNGVWVTRDKGLPFDRPAPASARVVPSLPPLPTTIFPITEQPPKIRVTSEYPRPITGQGVETIITWEDEEDPRRHVRVWLEDSSVRVKVNTPLGADTTGAERHLDLRPA